MLHAVSDAVGAEAFHRFHNDKVEGVRAFTANALVPILSTTSASMTSFQAIAVDYVID
jgi:hypothetical protein